MVVQCLTLMPQERGSGFESWLARFRPHGVLPVFLWVFPGYSSFLPLERHACQVRYTAAIAFDQDTGLRTRLGPLVLHYGYPLLPSNKDFTNAEDKLPNMVQ